MRSQYKTHFSPAAVTRSMAAIEQELQAHRLRQQNAGRPGGNEPRAYAI
jgi:hypothetical protein